MSHSSHDALQQRCQQIVTSPALSPEQNVIFWRWKRKTTCRIRHFLKLRAPRWTRGSSATCSKAMRLTNPLRSAGLRKISG